MSKAAVLRLSPPVIYLLSLVPTPSDFAPGRNTLSPRTLMTDRTLDGLGEATAQLRSAFVMRPMDEPALRVAVCGYVDAAKVLGWPVERVIVEIKRVAEVENGPVHRSNDPADRLDGQRVVARAVSWSVEHYFWTFGSSSSDSLGKR